jgi:hypothetical protein
MIIGPRTTSEVPHRSGPLPTPLGPHPADSVALGIPDPVPAYRPFVAPDIAWTGLRPDDSRWTSADPGPGVTRLGGPHEGRIEGLEVGSEPVVYQWKAHNYFWMLALDDVVDDLLLAGDEARHRVGGGKVEAPNGVVVPYRLLEAKDGTRRMIMSLPGGHELQVTSRKPLAPEAVKALCAGFGECPPVALRGLRDVYVVDSLGEKVDDELKTPAHPLSAITRVGVPDITFVHERLCDPSLGRHVVLHEVGHLVDGIERLGSVSTTQTDPEGEALFGRGAAIGGADHAFDISRDEFVSLYASLSPKEDFAETHALVLEQRTAYNLAHPGRDLLTEPAEKASAWLSERLGLKAEAVVERYHELGHVAPTESWATRVGRRVGLHD